MGRERRGKTKFGLFIGNSYISIIRGVARLLSNYFLRSSDLTDSFSKSSIISMPSFRRLILPLKVVSIVVVVLFTMNTLAWAQGTNLFSIFTKSPKEAPAFGLSDASESLSAKGVLPAEIGSVLEQHKGANGKIIFHIQDAHANYEAQKHIAGIIQYINKTYATDLIALEGTAGEINPYFLSTFPVQSAREKVADYFLKEAKITGPEYLAIAKGVPVKLVGIEDSKLYEENRKAFLEGLDKKDASIEAFQSLRRAYSGLRSKAFSDELKRLYRAKEDFESSQDGLVYYLAELVKMAKDTQVDLNAYPQVSALTELSRLEGSVDFKKAEIEAKRFVGVLQSVLPEEERANLISVTSEFQSGTVDKASYYSFLAGYLLTIGDPAKEFRSLPLYFEYEIKRSSVDLRLFDEIEGLEGAIKAKLFRSDTERKLDEMLRVLRILDKLFNFSLTRNDAIYFYNHRDAFSSNGLKSFYEEEAKNYSLLPLKADLGSIDAAVSVIERFYRLALDRDEVLVKNALSEMEKHGENTAVIVTGGFHTESVKRLLKEKGVSYEVILPRINNKVDETKEAALYERAMRGEPTPIEKLLTQAYLPSEPKIIDDPRYQLAFNSNLTRDGFNKEAACLVMNIAAFQGASLGDIADEWRASFNTATKGNEAAQGKIEDLVGAACNIREKTVVVSPRKVSGPARIEVKVIGRDGHRVDVIAPKVSSLVENTVFTTDGVRANITQPISQYTIGDSDCYVYTCSTADYEKIFTDAKRFTVRFKLAETGPQALPKISYKKGEKRPDDETNFRKAHGIMWRLLGFFIYRLKYKVRKLLAEGKIDEAKRAVSDLDEYKKNVFKRASDGEPRASYADLKSYASLSESEVKDKFPNYLIKFRNDAGFLKKELSKFEAEADQRFLDASAELLGEIAQEKSKKQAPKQNFEIIARTQTAPPVEPSITAVTKTAKPRKITPPDTVAPDRQVAAREAIGIPEGDDKKVPESQDDDWLGVGKSEAKAEDPLTVAKLRVDTECDRIKEELRLKLVSALFAEGAQGGEASKALFESGRLTLSLKQATELAERFSYKAKHVSPEKRATVRDEVLRGLVTDVKEGRATLDAAMDKLLSMRTKNLIERAEGGAAEPADEKAAVVHTMGQLSLLLLDIRDKETTERKQLLDIYQGAQSSEYRDYVERRLGEAFSQAYDAIDTADIVICTTFLRPAMERIKELGEIGKQEIEKADEKVASLQKGIEKATPEDIANGIVNDILDDIKALRKRIDDVRKEYSSCIQLEPINKEAMKTAIDEKTVAPEAVYPALIERMKKEHSEAMKYWIYLHEEVRLSLWAEIVELDQIVISWNERELKLIKLANEARAIQKTFEVAKGVIHEELEKKVEKEATQGAEGANTEKIDLGGDNLITEPAEEATQAGAPVVQPAEPELESLRLPKFSRETKHEEGLRLACDRVYFSGVRAILDFKEKARSALSSKPYAIDEAEELLDHFCTLYTEAIHDRPDYRKIAEYVQFARETAKYCQIYFPQYLKHFGNNSEFIAKILTGLDADIKKLFDEAKAELLKEFEAAPAKAKAEAEAARAKADAARRAKEVAEAEARAKAEAVARAKKEAEEKAKVAVPTAAEFHVLVERYKSEGEVVIDDAVELFDRAIYSQTGKHLRNSQVRGAKA
ncbi:MAG: hypothetical protein PHE61_01730, partial [Candidatus Omnitrophica bacterium]|nr:hypothetical protein [Candidatus Omnitrophota bacterium]